MSIISPICGIKRKPKSPIQFKGYTINFVNGSYRAEAYGNPQFSDTNLSKLKSKINKYLRS